MRKIIALIEVTRPLNNLMAMLSVWVGAFLANENWLGLKVLMAAISAGLVSAGGNAINDYYDAEIDLINKRNKPIPSGRILPKWVLLCSAILFFLGIYVSFLLGIYFIVVALSVSLLLWVYSAYLKKIGLTGNVVVSLVSSLTFLYGGMAVGKVSMVLFPIIFSFLFHLGREIIKDVQDMEADLRGGSYSIPIKYGKTKALQYSLFIFLFLIAITPVPYFLRIYKFPYLVLVILGVDVIVLWILLWILRYPYSGNIERASIFLKMDMLVGLSALILGR